jgi:hypothetical protein
MTSDCVLNSATCLNGDEDIQWTEKFYMFKRRWLQTVYCTVLHVLTEMTSDCVLHSATCSYGDNVRLCTAQCYMFERRWRQTVYWTVLHVSTEMTSDCVLNSATCLNGDDVIVWNRTSLPSAQHFCFAFWMSWVQILPQRSDILMVFLVFLSRSRQINAQIIKLCQDPFLAYIFQFTSY